MRKAVIDLEWLDAQIESEINRMKSSTHEVHFRGFERSKNMLRLVRSKCEPIEEPKEKEMLEMLKSNISTIKKLCAIADISHEDRGYYYKNIEQLIKQSTESN